MKYYKLFAGLKYKIILKMLWDLIKPFEYEIEKINTAISERRMPIASRVAITGIIFTT